VFIGVSAPGRAGAGVVELFVLLGQPGSPPERPGRPLCTTPSMSAATMSVAPAASTNLMIAVPAAPAPAITIRTSVIFYRPRAGRCRGRR
jgi:hypothetical protein